ncbi:helix-turn-helix domain-containing protein [Aliamphritea ceti]|uniref:helix-turn-helix domain-containing protein n=1 Tax=Aliamphritea ceti TaxID=1524258 RepID=UPI0035E411D6
MRHSRNSKAYAALAAWLKKKRLEQGLSIRDLANILDVHPSIVGKIETCMRKIDAIELIEYCNALGVDPNDCTAEVQTVMRGKRLL